MLNLNSLCTNKYIYIYMDGKILGIISSKIHYCRNFADIKTNIPFIMPEKRTLLIWMKIRIIVIKNHTKKVTFSNVSEYEKLKIRYLSPIPKIHIVN